MKRSTIVELIALLFVILFLYTGVSKLIDYDIDTEQIALTPLFEPIAPAVAMLLPITEIVVAIGLFLPATRRWSLWASLMLMVTFIGYILYILKHDAHLPCTCGGILQQLSWPQHLVLNVGLTALAIAGIVLSQTVRQTFNDRNKALANT